MTRMAAVLVVCGLAFSASAEAAEHRRLGNVDSQLRALASAQARGGDVQAAAERQGVTVAGGDVLVDVYVYGDVGAAADALRAQGMDIDAVSRRAPQRMVEGRLPVGALREVAAMDRVKAVVAVVGQGSDIGAITSEGDAAHRGPQARALGVTGEGVKVGVISDSIDQVGSGVSDSQTTGDLPGPASSPAGSVTVLTDEPGGSDEGRAMAEIIYDTATGVREMFFASGTDSGSAGKADAIDALVAAGAKVIADDIFYLSEPFFQDGIVAQAVDRANAAGVTYLASAGNRARRSWEGTFTPATDPQYHDFDAGDTLQTLGTFTDRTIQLAFQWDEAWGAAETDIDLDIYTISGGIATYLGSADTDNIATGLPRETVNLSTGAGNTVTFGIEIVRASGTRTPFMKYIVAGTQGGYTVAEYPTNSDAINPDATSAIGAISVAAVSALDSGLNTPETFSSRGPKTRLFDVNGNRLAQPEVRQKPEIAAADEVNTTVPGFDPFYGTSAATPSAAGIVALMLDANPALTPDAVRAVLRDTSHTNECTADALPRPDFDCGFGFELADGAVSQALDTTPPAVAPAPTGPVGANGFFTGDVTVAFLVADPESPVFKQEGCAPPPVTTDGTVTLTCTATSVGGTTSLPQTIKRDASPPSPPVIAGIAAGPYTLASVPAQSAISCSATDPHSALAFCSVNGYANTLGTHTLIASAANNAGLPSTTALTYTVIRNPFAISGLRKLSRLSRKALKKKGVQVRFTAAGPQTKVTVTVKKGKRTLGTKSATVGSGAKRVRVKLSKTGRKRLGKAKKVTISVKASAPGFSTNTLKATLKLKR